MSLFPLLFYLILAGAAATLFLAGLFAYRSQGALPATGVAVLLGLIAAYFFRWTDPIPLVGTAGQVDEARRLAQGALIPAGTAATGSLLLFLMAARSLLVRRRRVQAAEAD